MKQKLYRVTAGVKQAKKQMLFLIVMLYMSILKTYA